MPGIKHYAVVTHRRNKSKFCIMSDARTVIAAIYMVARGFHFFPKVDEFENRFEAYDATTLGKNFDCQDINFKGNFRGRVWAVMVYDAVRKYVPGIIYGAREWVLDSDRVFEDGIKFCEDGV